MQSLEVIFRASTRYEDNKDFYVYFDLKGIFILDDSVDKGAMSWEKDISNFLKGKNSCFQYKEITISSLLTDRRNAVREWAKQKLG